MIAIEIFVFSNEDHLEDLFLPFLHHLSSNLQEKKIKRKLLIY